MAESLASLLQAVEAKVAAGETNAAAVGPVERSLANWDGIITEEAMLTVNELRLRDRDQTARKSGEGRFRGSLLGSCPRMQIISFLGYIGADPDDVGADLMRDGTYRHYLWQEVGLSAGFLTEVETKTWNARRLFGGQLDGLMAPDPVIPGKGGFELKTTKWDFYKQVKAAKRPLHKHLLQIGGYMEALDLDWFSVVYEVRGARIDWREFVVYNDIEIQRLTEANFGGLRTWVERQEMPPIKENYPRDNECAYWCAFKKICPIVTFKE